MLGCELEDAPPMLIEVANSSKLISNMRAKGFAWVMQGCAFSYPVRVLKMGNRHLILGGDWLELHNPIMLNYTEVTLGLRLEGNM